MAEAFADGWAWWVIAIAIGFPVLLVGITELLGALRRRNSPLAGPVAILRNWVIPAGALLALLVFAIRSPADQVWVRVVATVFGFLLILLVLSAFNVVLFANATEGSWRKRIPTIFIEIARLVLVVVGLAILFAWVWEADVGGLFAALGVTSIVIGLALQNAVGGVISGLLLLFEQPFKIGDHLDTGGARGRVTEVNWRAVHIDTGSGIQIVPNSTLSGASFTNLSEPPGPFAATADVSFTTDDPPHEVVALLVDVAEGLPLRLPRERVSVEYSGKGAYSVSIPVASPADASRALTVYLSWLWYAARRRGLALDGDSTDPIAEPARLDAAIDALAPHLHLDEEDRELLRTSSRLERYGAGETVLGTGVVPDRVHFIVDGAVTVALEVQGSRIEFATAERGDLVGHTALTREPSKAVSTAAGMLTVLTVPLATVDALVRARPRLAADIGDLLDMRRAQATEALAERGLGINALTER